MPMRPASVEPFLFVGCVTPCLCDDSHQDIASSVPKSILYTLEALEIACSTFLGGDWYFLPCSGFPPLYAEAMTAQNMNQRISAIT